MTNAIDNTVMRSVKRQTINRIWFNKLSKTQKVHIRREGYNNKGCENIIISYNLLSKYYLKFKP